MKRQYELWQECNNFCTYCTLNTNNVKTPNELKVQAIKSTLGEIKQIKKDEVSVLGFIGGEFFQGQLHDTEVKNLFYELILQADKMLSEDIIKELWINATLTIGNQSDLLQLLSILKNHDKIWIATSYDTKGRFHNNKMLETWENNINYIHEQFPEIKINTTSILTGDFINKYLKDEIDLQEFKMKYKTSLFLKTPVKPMETDELTKEQINKDLGYEFFPKRKDFLNFLIKFKEKEGQTEYDNLFSNTLKAEELHRNYNDSELRNIIFHRSNNFEEKFVGTKLKEATALPCGHADIYNCYSDIDGCAICDKLLIDNL